MLNKIRNALYRFMYGRNGADQLSQFILILGMIIIIPAYFIRSNIRFIFMIIFWILIIYSYFRIFSKKVYKRQAENQKFVGKLNYVKQRFSQRKQYRFYNCPKCKTHLRVPRGAGKITITCKKCGYQFDKKA